MSIDPVAQVAPSAGADKSAGNTAGKDSGHGPSSSGQSATRPQSRHEEEGRRIILVTGMAGAGRSTALKCLEDLGYEAVDNLPLALAPHLLSGLSAASSDVTGERNRPIAIGIDARTRDFTAQAVTDLVAQLRGDRWLDSTLIFMDCEDEILRRRFTETRRRHPLAPDGTVLDGIQQERRLIAPLRLLADLIIDTSDQASGDLKRLLSGRFALDRRSGVAISVVSFSFRRGLPREADLVFDVRFLDNPHYDPVLRPLTGEDEAVGAMIAADPAFATFFPALTDLLLPLLPGYEREGKSYLTVAIGCTGGRHRSVYVARRVAEWLRQRGQDVALTHRDLERL
ncbi:MAG: RNase adapter RapZ [Rhodospirillaceae bacterium]|nr:MAG: RNase adapter RapZ [Rhodospirillaceae bacterium]